jgi:hypothetical protein
MTETAAAEAEEAASDDEEGDAAEARRILATAALSCSRIVFVMIDWGWRVGVRVQRLRGFFCPFALHLFFSLVVATSLLRLLVPCEQQQWQRAQLCELCLMEWRCNFFRGLNRKRSPAPAYTCTRVPVLEYSYLGTNSTVVRTT